MLGHAAVSESSVQRALHRLEEQEFDIVISDFKMTEMTGVEFLRRIRGGHPDAIRLLFTGYADIRALCQSNPLVSWAAYIGGSIFTLLKEEPVTLPYGFSLLLFSAVPIMPQM